MGMRHLLNPKKRSYYNVDFVFGEIEKFVPFDYDAYNSSLCKSVAAVTNIETGKAEYIDVSKHDGNWDALVASCSLPILFKPVKLGEHLYMDGGITDPIPVNKAIEDGCDKIIVITTRERSFKKDSESGIGLSSFIYRKYPNFVSRLKSRVNIYNEAHKNVIELEEQGKIFLITPEDTSGWRRTESDPVKIRKMHDSGFAIAQSRFCELENYLKN